jgi:hypothetical protein
VIAEKRARVVRLLREYLERLDDALLVRELQHGGHDERGQRLELPLLQVDLGPAVRDIGTGLRERDLHDVAAQADGDPLLAGAREREHVGGADLARGRLARREDLGDSLRGVLLLGDDQAHA